MNTFFISCPLNLEHVLEKEVSSILNRLVEEGVLKDSGYSLKERQAGVELKGGIEAAYALCLWSRTASRVLMELCRFQVKSADDIYRNAFDLPWSEHLDPGSSIAVDASVKSAVFGNPSYTALVVKDGLVDRMKKDCGRRPSVDTDNPDFRINLYINKQEARISLDFSGESLHRRSYRRRKVAAPLKENTAAAVLLRAGWAETAGEGRPFCDLMCGSGTFCIEAAMIAADMAPALQRSRFGFHAWKQHRQDGIWKRLKENAARRFEEGRRRMPPIAGMDSFADAVSAARANAAAAGLKEHISFLRGDFRTADPRLLFGSSGAVRAGLLAVNPPYGERLMRGDGLQELYQDLGLKLKRSFPNWRAAVLAGNRKLSRALGLRAEKVYTVFNGTIECALSLLSLTEDNRWRKFTANEQPNDRNDRTDTDTRNVPDDPGPPVRRSNRHDNNDRHDHDETGHQTGEIDIDENLEMFRNRLKKNRKQRQKWAAREKVSCYRLYDADIPEFNAAIDFYENRWVHVQEYAAPSVIEEDLAAARLDGIIESIPDLLGVKPEDVFLKTRRKQRGKEQYEKHDNTGVFHEVCEGGHRFLVNFTDYLDTGIFLDHRPVRAMIEEAAHHCRFLNLFCYTATASVYAAAGRAFSTTNIDSSRTYLEWAEKNMKLNGFSGGSHRFIREDCRSWLAEEQNRYDLIFLDPPTFSNSKNRREDFDVAKDYPQLINAALRVLEPRGQLIFSTNYRKFKLDPAWITADEIRDLSGESIPFDFKRNRRIHRCWLIG